MPVRVCARPFAATRHTAAEIVRLARGLNQPVVLAGDWAAGEIVIATDPIAVSVGPFDGFSVLEQQPRIEGEVPEGALGGGWFGWFGFEGQAHAVGFYPHVLRLVDGQWWDEALVGILPDDVLEQRRQKLCALLQGLAASEPYALGPVSPSRGRSEHVAAVERCLQAIRAGEIYQANICLTLQASFTGSPADLCADLLTSLQPPYGAYVALGERRVASASPELFLHRSSRKVTSTPIKGTRPRTPSTSDAERRRLKGSQKDRAENVMIVDLVRNDLSRVAEIGTVRVTRLLDVVAAPGVWHLVSSVDARLRADVSDADLLRATFPPGSVSGAPKSRAVEIIADLEDRPRGVYTGAIGYASPVLGAQFSVAIRTVDILGDSLSLGVGGGITVDSTPLQEWWECFDKARPLLDAVGGRIADADGRMRRPAPDPLAAAGICDTSLLRFGAPCERAEHLARLERACYELYGSPLPIEAADALLRPPPSEIPWQRQRIDVIPGGTVSVVRRPAPRPVPIAEQGGVVAVVLASDSGFGAYKWADRRRQSALEEQSGDPETVVILGGGEGLLESTRANVFAVIGDRLVTAPLDGRVLPGVTRTVLLEIARDLGIQIELTVPDPCGSSALAVASSVAGMRWIRRCGDLEFPDPGGLLRELSRRLVDRWTAGATVAR